LQGLLSAPWRFSLTYLSQIVKSSHDQLTRSLVKQYSWRQILKLILNRNEAQKGYLVIDETEIDKSYARTIQGLGWIKSHKQGKYIFGLQLVVLVWTDGDKTIPLSWKIYEKGGDKTKIDLALELLHYGLKILGIKPKAVLFDAFYSSEKVLKYLIKQKLIFCSQLPKNRLFNHKQLRLNNKGRPYWVEIGKIKGNIVVQVIKNRRKYFVTNDLNLSREKQLETYKIRWRIEEVFRFSKSELGMEQCRARSLRAQSNHVGCCFLLYAILQDMAEKTQMTDYAIKQKATFDHNVALQLDLSPLLEFA
jgi:putative transposase